MVNCELCYSDLLILLLFDLWIYLSVTETNHCFLHSQPSLSACLCCG